MKLFHQCGHCTKWNIDAYTQKEIGDGLIFSPVHERRERIESFPTALKRASFFDPQYYLPNSQKTKLHTYNFFPEVVASGFSTIDFSLVAMESAKLCLEFQATQQFSRIVIPARYFSQMDPDYTDKQAAYTVVPFLKEIGKQRLKKPVYLTLPLTSHMVEHAGYRTGILNWVTSFPEISGVYLIPDNARQTKQVTSRTYISEMLKLLTEIQDADLQLVVGYSNTESLLYTLTGDPDITMGAYENTRIFSMDKFVESDEDRRGPKARMYLSGLLNWLQFTQAKDLKLAEPALWARAYAPTTWGDAALKLTVEPAFNQDILYRHYFAAFAEQVDALRPLSRLERYRKIRTWLRDAIDINSEIEDAAIDLERHGQGFHLQTWLDAVNSYYTSHLKP